MDQVKNMQKYRIGMVLDKNLPDMRVENEADILGKAGFDVILLCLDYTGSKIASVRKENYNVYSIPFKKFYVDKLRPFSGTVLDFYTIVWRSLIRDFINRFNIEILHLHDLYMGLPALNMDFPFVIDLHENYPASIVSYNWSRKFPLNYILNKNLWKKKEYHIFRKAKGIITLSDTFADELINEYCELDISEKVCTYPNVPDLEFLASLNPDKTLYTNPGRFSLLYFGVVAERRGIFECFEALGKLKDEIPELHLLIVGPVDNADRQRFDENLNMYSERITYIPWVNIEDFASLVKHVDLGLSPLKKNEQHDSGVANKIFQYMFFELPILVSDCIPQKKIVITHNCGYYYNSGNIEDFSLRLLTAYSEKDKLAVLGNNGKKAVETEYNTKTAGKRITAFYEHMAGKL